MATDELTISVQVAASQTIVAGDIIAQDSSGYAIKCASQNARTLGVAVSSVTTNSSGFATSLNGATVTAQKVAFLGIMKRKTNVPLTGFVDTTGGSEKTSIIPGDIVCVNATTATGGPAIGQGVVFMADPFATPGAVLGRVRSGSLTYNASVVQSGTLYVDLNVV